MQYQSNTNLIELDLSQIPTGAICSLAVVRYIFVIYGIDLEISGPSSF